MSFQKWLGMGRIGHTPELKQTDNGRLTTTFSIAIERDYHKNSEKITDWFDCVAWNGVAEFIAKYFAKGDMIFVEGREEKRKYTDRNGVEKTVCEVKVDRAEFCGSKEKKENALSNIEITVDDLPKHTLEGVKENELKDIPMEDDLPF